MSTSPTTSSRPIRTILTMNVVEGSEEAFEAAWARAAAVIAAVPGQLRQQLMVDARDPRAYSIVSDWTDRDSVDAFGRSSARETLTEALREMRQGASRATYRVLASVEGDLEAQLEAEPVVEAPRALKASPTVRISFSTPVEDGEQEDFERLYEVMAQRVADRGSVLREELLLDEAELRYYIFAEWESAEHFARWVHDPSHKDDGAPLARWHAVEFRRETLEVRQRPRSESGPFAAVPAAGETDAGTRVRVDLGIDVAAGDQDAFERAYLAAAELAVAAPGHVREELLCEQGGLRYHVLGEWESLEDFERWAAGPGHLHGGPLGRWVAGADRRVLALRRRIPMGHDLPGGTGAAGEAAQPGPAAGVPADHLDGIPA